MKLSDALNICLIQIHILVDNLSKRNFPQSSREISEVISQNLQLLSGANMANIPSRSLPLLHLACSPWAGGRTRSELFRRNQWLIVETHAVSNCVINFLSSSANSLAWKQRGIYCVVYFHQSISETHTQQKIHYKRSCYQVNYRLYWISHRSYRVCVLRSRIFFRNKRWVNHADGRRDSNFLLLHLGS